MNGIQILSSAETSVSHLTDKLGGWASAAVALLPNLAVSVLVLFAFGFISRMSARVVRQGLVRSSSSQQVTRLAVQVVRVGVVVAGVFVALGVLGLDKTVSSLLAGVGIMGLAVGFAFQDLLANLMSGILLAFRRPFERGELIRTNDMMGHVMDTKLSATQVQTFQGQMVWIPNKQVLESVLTNFSRLGARRVEIDVGVSYGDDLDTAEQACRDALESLSFRDSERGVDVWFTGFGASSIDMSARLWIDLSNERTNFLHAQSQAIKAIKRSFDHAGITIPFPIRTMDFGIVGGESLKEHWPAAGADGRGGERSANGSDNDKAESSRLPS